MNAVLAWFQERRGLCYYAASFVCVGLMDVVFWYPPEIAYRRWILLALFAAGVAFRVMTRRDLAEASGVPQSTISAIERERINLGVSPRLPTGHE